MMATERTTQNQAILIADLLVGRGFEKFLPSMFTRPLDAQHGLVVLLRSRSGYEAQPRRPMATSVLFGLARRDVNDLAASWLSHVDRPALFHYPWRATVAEAQPGEYFPDASGDGGRSAFDWRFDQTPEEIMPELELGLACLERWANLDQVEQLLGTDDRFFQKCWERLADHALSGRLDAIERDLDRLHEAAEHNRVVAATLPEFERSLREFMTEHPDGVERELS